MSDEPEGLDPAQMLVANRAANEGIPIGAIGRILQCPYGVVSEHLKLAANNGAIGTMPKPDWPPSQHSDARLPTIQRTANSDDIEVACHVKLKLTRLETAFLVVLLRNTHCDKEKLHVVIETQRAARQMQPNKLECTEVKMVDVIICKLRAKLKRANPDFVIKTVWARGYFIEPAVKEAIFKLIGAPNAFNAEQVPATQ